MDEPIEPMMPVEDGPNGREPMLPVTIPFRFPLKDRAFSISVEEIRKELERYFESRIPIYPNGWEPTDERNDNADSD